MEAFWQLLAPALERAEGTSSIPVLDRSAAIPITIHERGKAVYGQLVSHMATVSELRQVGNYPEQRPLLHLSAPNFNPAFWVDTVLLSGYRHAGLLPGGIPLTKLKTLEFKLRWITTDSDISGWSSLGSGINDSCAQ